MYKFSLEVESNDEATQELKQNGFTVVKQHTK
jgi:hypothetical protein